jgi:uncharacterized Zn-finger protein
MCQRFFAFAVNLKKHFWFCHSTSGGQLKLKASFPQLPLPLQIGHNSREDQLNEKYEDMTCSICNKACKNWKLLEIHMLSHTKETPYKCQICDRGFKDEQKLKRHAVVHTKEKNYACGVCGKKFGLKHNKVSYLAKRPFT